VKFVYGFKNGGETTKKIDRAFTFIGSCGSCKKENKFRKKISFEKTISRNTFKKGIDGLKFYFKNWYFLIVTFIAFNGIVC